MEKELTILVPCLNEEKTIGICIKKAQKFLNENNINGEILVADNGSTDNSIKIANSLGARVFLINKKGYGNALREGTKYATGKYVIMADADDSYSFLEILLIWKELKSGKNLVIGNRFKGKMEKGAMPFSHKYIGTPMLSFLVRKKYKVNIGDINCGLRGYENKKILELGCTCEGMEYATEMIIKAKKSGLSIAEVPINFYKDGRDRKPHLNTIKDGIRHLKIIIRES
jgi:glycosyltransferase involved in cell wall biosynthesis